ncbi:YceI family protein [bacterium]|nr:YceI family protein [bacterium]NUN46136.1 YceI family protein [bacterium]
MNRMMVFAAALLINVSAFAQSNWGVDVSHSNVLFTVSHLVVSDVQGYFKEFDATLGYSKEDFSDATATMTIKVNSINTGIEKRDAHLKADDFFAADKFADITFASKSFKKTGKNTFKITGDLTMRGTTKTVELDAVYRGEIKDPWGNTKSGWKINGTVNRFDYGLKWNAAMETGGLVVGENVDITINLEMVKKK